MKRCVYDAKGIHLLRTEEAEPECGVDFCDSCGDCLECYGGDWCGHNREEGHRWVVYEETPELEAIQ